MTRALLALAIALPMTALASPQDCSSVPGDAERLRCFDTLFPKAAAPKAVPAPAAPASSGTIEPAPVETGSTLPDFLKNFKLASEATPAGALRSDPASFSYAKLNDEEYSTIQAALIWEPSESWFPKDSYLSTYGWGPYASASINRNSLSTKRADVRQAAVGLYGTLFKISAPKVPGALIAETALGTATKVEVGYRQNKIEDSKSVMYTLDNWVVSKWLFDGIPYRDTWAWFVAPRFGLQLEDRRSAKPGGLLGKTRSAFWQLKADLYPGPISDRLKVALLTQRYVDLSASSGIAERYETFSKIGIEYLLYPPRLGTPAVQPSIALERSFGADLLAGLPKQGLTQVVFKLKLN